ncbi:hypothetical protein EBZ80_01220 [bacterium]|nr:hypothetical protein [bacterium]
MKRQDLLEEARRRADSLHIPFLPSVHGKTKATLRHFLDSTRDGLSREFLDTLTLRTLAAMVGEKGLDREHYIDRLLSGRTDDDTGISPIRPLDLIDG